jgi:hypothetical protein
MVSSGMLHRVALVRTDVSEETSASFIRVTRIGEQGTTLAATSNRRTLRRITKRQFLQEPHGVTSQKTPFFIVTAVKTSNLTKRDELTGVWRKLHNEELCDLYSSANIIRNIKWSRMMWAGRVARIGAKRNAYRLLVRKRERKRPLGRPRRF